MFLRIGIVCFGLSTTIHAMYYSNELKPWQDAENYCQNECYSHLLSIHSQKQYNETIQFLHDNNVTRNVYIGLNDLHQNFTYVYSDGTPFDFGNDTSGGVYPWNSAPWLEPDHGAGGNPQHCIHLWYEYNFKWDDVECMNQRQYQAFLCNDCVIATPSPTVSPIVLPTSIPTTNRPTTTIIAYFDSHPTSALTILTESSTTTLTINNSGINRHSLYDIIVIVVVLISELILISLCICYILTRRYKIITLKVKVNKANNINRALTKSSPTTDTNDTTTTQITISDETNHSNELPTNTSNINMNQQALSLKSLKSNTYLSHNDDNENYMNQSAPLQMTTPAQVQTIQSMQFECNTESDNENESMYSENEGNDEVTNEIYQSTVNANRSRNDDEKNNHNNNEQLIAQDQVMTIT